MSLLMHAEGQHISRAMCTTGAGRDLQPAQPVK